MPGLSEFLAAPAHAGVWNLVPDRTSLAVKSKTFWGLVPVTTRFTDVSGQGQLTATGEVTGRIDVKAASLSSGIKKRDEHLRSADFFDVDKYPDIVVAVTGATVGQGNSADLKATLTVAGTTRPVALPASISVLGDGTVQVSVNATIQRDEFGVDGNMAGMMGNAATLVADAVFTRAG